MALILGFVMLTGALVFVPGGAVALPEDAWITGVVDDGVDPLPDVYVKVMIMISNSIDVGYAYTDADGEYLMSVPGGFEYMVIAADGDHYMTMTSASVDVGETAWANMTMTNISPEVADVTIKGYVSDEWGVPATGGHVLGITNDPMGVGDDMPIYANPTTPDGFGYFEVNVLPSATGGGAVAFDNEGYSMVDNTTDTSLVSGMTYWFNITLEGLSEYEDATIYGHVTDAASGLPIEGAFISYESWDSYTDESYSNYTFTDASGDYEMNVMSGEARVWIMRGGYSMVMYENEPVSPGADVQFDAALIALDCVVRGNVTDLKSSLPLQMARVFVMDFEGNMVMALTDDLGRYELESFSGEDMYLAAQADGYSQDVAVVTLNPGDEIWHDFGLYPVSAWIEGTVTDIISGADVEGAWVWAESDSYSDGTNTDSSGYYNISVVPGDYTVRVNAMDYREATADVAVLDEAATVQDFELIPWNIQETVMVSGYVTDSVSAAPISSAEVRVALPDMSFSNQTFANDTGYYMIYVAPLDGLLMGVTGYGHGPFFTTIDCDGLTTLDLDVQLAPDPLRPNVTMSQSPLENVSWNNPMTIDAEAEDPYMRQIILWNLMPWYSDSGYDYKYVFAGGSVSFDPFSPDGGLEYIQVGDNYSISMVFDGMVDDASMIGGWLDNGTAMTYMSAYEQWWGPEVAYAARAYYTNDTLDEVPGTAFFDSETGEYMLFHFDWGFPEADPDDTTAVIEFTASVMSFEQSNPQNWMWMGDTVLCEAGVPEIMFTADPTVPSGEYATLFVASDFGDGWNWSAMLYTVDNGVPVADAGLDQLDVPYGDEVQLNGTLSSDNVGVVSWTWTFDDDGPVSLSGIGPLYTFSAPGEYNITLNVTDAAGNWDTDNVIVTVVDTEPPVADAGEDPEGVTAGESVTLVGSGSSDNHLIAEYTWVFNDSEEVTLDGEVVSYTFMTEGDYEVTLTVVDASGNSDTDIVVVRVGQANEGPVADAGPDQLEVVEGDTVTFDGEGSSDDVGIVTYTWTFDYDGEPQTLTGEVVTFVFEVPGTYIVTLNVTDAEGEWETDTLVVVVGEKASTFVTEYWWLMAVLAAVIVIGAVLLMKRGKGGSPKDADDSEEFEEEELPPPDEDDI